MDDFAKMLLSRHESNKSQKDVPAQQPKDIKVSLFSKNNEGEHVELNQDDFSMLSLMPKDTHLEESTLPLEPAEYSPFKSPTKVVCDKVSEVVESQSSDGSPINIIPVQKVESVDNNFFPVEDEQVVE